MKTPLFYHKRPVFGLDIGSQAVKFVQLNQHARRATVQAYGSIATKEKIMQNGVIIDIPKAAQLIDELLAKKTFGHLTTNRAAMSIPVSRVFTRVLTLPLMSRKELESAIQLEVEQSVPLAASKLYFDYETTDIGDAENVLVRMVATPREIVDSYVAVCDLLKLDLALIQTNIRANAELCMHYEDLESDSPYIILEVGSEFIDVGILDDTLRLTGTVEAGGNSLTAAIATELGVTKARANTIKVTKGLAPSKDQKKVQQAVSPILNKVVQEIERVVKFYNQRVREGSQISQIIIVGGGANMPGLGDYLTNATRIPTRVSAPWSKHIMFGHLKPPKHADLPRFLTCAGLALAKESEILGL